MCLYLDADIMVKFFQRYVSPCQMSGECWHVKCHNILIKRLMNLLIFLLFFLADIIVNLSKSGWHHAGWLEMCKIAMLATVIS